MNRICEKKNNLIYYLHIGNYPIRLIIGILLFLASFTSYILRVNMSINILGMVYPTHHHHHNDTTANSTVIVHDVRLIYLLLKDTIFNSNIVNT